MTRRFEDCNVGDRVTTPGRTITAADIEAFADLSGDRTPLHTDAAYAATTQFGERVAHGMLVLSIASAMLVHPEDSGIVPLPILALVKLDRVRFLAPAKIGDTIHTECEVLSTDPLDPERGLVTVRGKVKNQRAETVAAFRTQLLVGR